MKPRHAAALALVGWYLMFPPEKCIDRSRSDLGSCEMEFDAEADLSEWEEGPNYPNAEACNTELERLHNTATDPTNTREEANMKCVSSGELRKAREAHTNPN
jgi:hypothetical protein